MKISRLRQRENFDEIFVESLRAFLSVRTSEDIVISGEPHAGLNFRINPELNIIFPETTSGRDLFDLVRHFTYSNSSLATLLRTIYCNLAIHNKTRNLFSDRSVSIHGGRSEISNLVFLPGNHSIRAIDLSANQSIVFPKKGFDESFFRQDAQIRLQHPFLLAPKILENCPSWTWYTEQRVTGIPLSRLRPSEKKDNSLELAATSLVMLREKTLRKNICSDYMQELLQRIKSFLNEHETWVTPFEKEIACILNAAESCKASNAYAPIYMGMSHGDFHSGNIIVGSNETWLTDWEYSAERAVTYDFFINATDSRSLGNLADRMIRLYKKIQARGGIDVWGLFQEGSAKTLFSIFLLEDLELRLHEIATAQIFNKKMNFLPWLRQATEFTKHLQES